MIPPNQRPQDPRSLAAVHYFIPCVTADELLLRGVAPRQSAEIRYVDCGECLDNYANSDPLTGTDESGPPQVSPDAKAIIVWKRGKGQSRSFPGKWWRRK